MGLTELADIADLVAAVAVIISLVFVGYELRMTRKQSELSNWREVLQTFTDYKAATNNIEFADFIVRAHQDYEALSPAERMSFGLFLEQGVHICGNFLKHNDSLPKKLVGLEEAIMSTFSEMQATPGGAAWWAEAHQRGRFMTDTYTTVNRLLERCKREKSDDSAKSTT